MPLYANVGGSWRTVGAPSVNVNGSWRSVVQGWVNVAGAWRTFFAAFTSYQHLYTGPTGGSDTVPVGSKQVVIELWAAGGGSDQGYGSPGSPSHGTGGGGGGYVRKTVTISPSQWGQAINFTLGANGVANTTASNSFVANTSLGVNLTAGGGGGAGVGSIGAGGAATGGDVNTTGNPGHQSTAGGSDGLGGAAITGLHGPTNVANFGGSSPGLSGSAGQPGGVAQVSFLYT